jgi:REP-associated tyrosine transposase
MSQSLVQNYIHLVFSTKNRMPWFRDAELRNKIYAYLAGACSNLDCPAFQIGGFTDHVHILCGLSKNLALKDLVMNIKKNCSKWIKQEHDGFQEFQWQVGYAGFSISPSHVEALKQYILSQEKHHSKESFQDELRRLLSMYGIEHDEKYLWT